MRNNVIERWNTEIQTNPELKTALVFGGTGTVGREIVAGLLKSGVRVLMTFYQAEDQALARVQESENLLARYLDLSKPAEIRNFFKTLQAEGFTPDIFIHAAVFLGQDNLTDDAVDENWSKVQAVNAASAHLACLCLPALMQARGGGDIIFLGALDRSQTLPLPPHFAASQGALAAMAMAFARRLGPENIRVNMVALGPLTGGLSKDLDDSLLSDYKKYSSLGRLGTPLEAARFTLWLALQNPYINGKVLAVNGGI